MKGRTSNLGLIVPLCLLVVFVFYRDYGMPNFWVVAKVVRALGITQI
jgi:hypothetical protein